MYYEEKYINGVLHFRTTPNGEWREFDIPAVDPLSSKGEAVSESAGGEEQALPWEVVQHNQTRPNGQPYKGEYQPVYIEPLHLKIGTNSEALPLAQYIVTACNEYPELREREAVLVEALEKARGWMGVYLDVPCYRQMLADDKEFVKAALEAKP